MANNLAKLMKQQHDKGVIDGGLYWTSVMTVALHNLYRWKGHTFDKIEEEMKRIDDEVRGDSDTSIATEVLIGMISDIRGKDYFKGGTNR